MTVTLLSHNGNYLRVRGEYATVGWFSPRVGELPPRARRIRYHGEAKIVYNGTTSACAENTPFSIRKRHNRWNYLRVRGEYPK